MQPDLRLVVTDLDGTLIGPATELPLYERFRDVINQLRRERGAVWVACTGRSMASFRDFFRPLQAISLTPEYVIANHAYIFKYTRFGYMPHLWWCLAVRRRIHRDARECMRLLKAINRDIRHGSHGVRMALKEPGRLRLRFDSEASASAALAVIQRRLADRPDMAAERALTEVEVHTIPHTKGLAVTELAGHLGLHRDQVLTIGDGYNDLSMLTPSVAGHAGCPGNAETVVIEAVHRAGGHISRFPTLSGVLDILQAVLDGNVCSDIPDDRLSARRSRGGFARRPRHGGSAPHSRRRSLLLCAAIIAVCLLVLASFNLIPGSELIVRPIHAAMAALADLLFIA